MPLQISCEKLSLDHVGDAMTKRGVGEQQAEVDTVYNGSSETLLNKSRNSAQSRSVLRAMRLRGCFWKFAPTAALLQ